VCNLETAELIEVIDSHKQDEIIKTLMSWSLEQREAVTEVSVDMWGGFTKVIKTVGSLGIAPKIVYWYTIMTLLVRQNHCTARVLVI